MSSIAFKFKLFAAFFTFFFIPNVHGELKISSNNWKDSRGFIEITWDFPLDHTIISTKIDGTEVLANKDLLLCLASMDGSESWVKHSCVKTEAKPELVSFENQVEFL